MPIILTPQSAALFLRSCRKVFDKPGPDLACGWVRLPNGNPLFGGAPALKLMIEGGIDGLYQVRRLLDARRGGWN